MLTPDQLRVLQTATADKHIAIIEPSDVWKREAAESLSPLIEAGVLLFIADIRTLTEKCGDFSGALVGAIALGFGEVREASAFSNERKFPIVVTTDVSGVKIEIGTIMPQGPYFAIQEGRSPDWPVTALSLLAELLQKNE